MHQDSTPIDLISLTQYLEDTGRLEKVGGAGIRHGALHFRPNSHQYLRITWRSSAKNMRFGRLRKLGQELSFDALNGGNIPVGELISKGEGQSSVTPILRPKRNASRSR